MSSPVTGEIVLPPQYQLQSVLKESATTCVYRVFDLADQREETLKLLRHEFFEPRDVLQFKKEFAALAALDHPGIVRVYDFGLLDSRYPYFTMEYFAGRKLTEFFDGQNWDALYEVLVQIASALHHIHDAGIIHLDLKPSNILVNEGGRVKIMDFGMVAEKSEVLDRRIRGTLHYMAPEVLRQDRVDSRADLYALGMTLYETVTGALPTYGLPALEIIRFHLSGELRKPSRINPSIPDRLERLILRLLEKDARHRYPTAAALLHDAAMLAGNRVDTTRLAPHRAELLAAPLIGRTEEAAAISQAIDEARRGHGGGLIVEGREGTGKSRLVRETTLRAQIDGARVFVGRCPVNRKSVYAPFVEIFQQMLAAISPDVDPAGEIRRLLRPGAETGSEARTGKAQKFRLFNRIVQSIQDIHGFLSAVGAGGLPLILIVEDLQWADPASIELLSFLVGESRGSSLLVIGTLTTLEPDAVPEGDAASLASWEQRAKEGSIPILRLDAFTEAEVREYLESLLGMSPVPHDFVRWILWESGGSPLDIRRVIEHLIEHGHLQSRADGWVADMDGIHGLRIPGGAAALWNERLENLAGEDLALLQAASVLGQEVDLALLAKVVGLSAEESYASLNRLAGAGLLEESVDGRTFYFPQMSLRELIYSSADDASRTEAHRRAAEALETLLEQGVTEVVGQAAYHYARGNDEGKGIAYSIRAGDLAGMALAHEQAAEFYRIALELMDLSGEETRRAEIREKLGDACYRSNNLRGAMQVYQFLLKSLQTRSSEDDAVYASAGVMKKIGKVLSKRSETEAALSYFQNALRIYERLGTAADKAEMYSRIAWMQKQKGDLAEAERAARHALSIAEQAGLTRQLGYVKNTLGLIAATRGEWQEARGCFSEAIAVADASDSDHLRKVARANLAGVMFRLGDWDLALELYRGNLEQSESEGDLWDLVSAYNSVGQIEMSRGNFHLAADLFERSVRYAEKLGAPESEGFAQANLGRALEMLGRWPEAREHYRKSIEIDGFDEGKPNRVAVYVPLARLLGKLGDFAKALGYAQRACDTAERCRHDPLLAEGRFVLAQIERERENHPDAFRHAEEAMSIFERLGDVHATARVHAFLADLLFRTQSLNEATLHAETAIEIASGLKDRHTVARAEWVAGKILFTTGNREEAEQKFELARGVFDELDTPFESGRALFELGLLKDEPEEATQTIREAIRIFERLEASADLERARGALFRIRPAGRVAEGSVIGLYEVVKVINSTLHLEEVLNRVLDIALRRLRAERGMLILNDPITSEPRTRVVRNIHDGVEEGSRRSPQAITREVIQSGRSIISADARADDRFIDSDSVISDNIISTLCVPLVIRDQIAGAIYVDHRQTRHLFSQRDLNFLEAFADQAAIAIENARLYEELENAKVRLSLENESLRREVLVEKHLDSVVGHSEVVARIQFTIRKAAASISTVLLRGESGTGKGLVARIIHNAGPRRNGPFIKFNCAALPETLAESELFGHEKGAFTGADRRKLGRFELSNGGTIFLDEIGRISLAMQAKLLRVVEEKEFERVGGTQTLKTDVKIIAAANNDLERAIEEGTFREDLFYRLNIIPLVLPPLRDRKEDIPLLAEHFIRKICRDLGIEPKRLEPGVIDFFMQHRWPGNIRELEATLHRAIVMSSGDLLRISDFYGLLGEVRQPKEDAPVTTMPDEVLSPFVKRLPINDGAYEDIMARVDRQLIRQALSESGGKIREAARRLGLARNTLKAKLQKYDISASE
ncbi:MAG TPA: sigma 54-interacting transcriptional regulator [Thermoanaerobaculia bacterium]|nr:sigma 54-interacting transcriptional regulator [Thermoanaerobaculia bacterium]